MSFDNLVKIIDATLLNKPTITKFEEIESDVKKIKWGDLFITSSQDNISLAIANGAYGVLCDFECKIVDEEIAWIRVENIQKSLRKLLRLRLLEANHSFYYFDMISYEILKSISLKSNLVFLDTDMIQNYKKILNSKDNSMIISNDKNTLKDIYPDFIEDYEYMDIKLDKSTLFNTSFSYKEKYYCDLKFSPIFLYNLSLVLHFLDQHKFSYDLHKIELKSHFNPIFITDQFKIKSFGDSEHVLIIEEDNDILSQEYDYIKAKAKWATLLHSSLEELPNLNISEFNFILIQANYNEVIKFLEKFSTRDSQSLFAEL